MPQSREPLTWPGLADIHPFAPDECTIGIRQMISQLEEMLVAITGYDAVSLQPNAGSQGEFAGLLAIHAYHRSRGDTSRDVCLIPSSAHGTNAASAVMAGLNVVVVRCDAQGNIDLADLEAKASAAGDALAAAMVTYPSTHGVFEAHIGELCEIVHRHGGQVYVDGANLNAMVGLAQPGKFGADVSHLNLHKTFCIPHGGGGPGVGPVAVRAHLAEFLPGSSAGFRRSTCRCSVCRSVRLGEHPGDLVGVHRLDGRFRSHRRKRDGRAQRQLHRHAAQPALPGSLHR